MPWAPVGVYDPLAEFQPVVKSFRCHSLLLGNEVPLQAAPAVSRVAGVVQLPSNYSERSVCAVAGTVHAAATQSVVRSARANGERTVTWDLPHAYNGVALNAHATLQLAP